MHHTNPHHPVLPKPQHLTNQPHRVKRPPSKPKPTTLPLHRLNYLPRLPVLNRKTNSRHSNPHVRAPLPPNRHILPRIQPAQQRRLQLPLVRNNALPFGLAREVGGHGGDAVHKLVAGAGESELLLEGALRVEEVAQGAEVGLGEGAGVEEGDVRAVDLGSVKKWL